MAASQSTLSECHSGILNPTLNPPEKQSAVSEKVHLAPWAKPQRAIVCDIALAAEPKVGAARTMRLPRQAASNVLDTHLDRAQDCLGRAELSDDWAEDVTVFLELRSANVRGT